MNTHRVALRVGSDHFSANPVGTLHRAISEPSLAAWRRRCAVDAITYKAACNSGEAFNVHAANAKAYNLTWRIAVGTSSATQALKKANNLVDAACGTCFAQRAIGRPAWESEGFLSQLGKVPLHGLTLVGAKLGAAYATANQDDARDGASRGARLGAIVGGSIAYLWSQGLALVGLAAKLAMVVPTAAYLTLVQSFEPMNKELLRDALCGTGLRFRDEAFSCLKEGLE